jgi:hypothetical protein
VGGKNVLKRRMWVERWRERWVEMAEGEVVSIDLY